MEGKWPGSLEKQRYVGSRLFSVDGMYNERELLNHIVTYVM